MATTSSTNNAANLQATTTVTAAPGESRELRAPAKAGSGRLISLDIFRGATIAGMILVNNPGSWNAIYWPLEHAEWHGWTPTDLIFPFFLFIVGVSMVLSFGSRREKGATRGRLLLHAVQRSAIIFAIGFMLAFWPKFDVHTVRIPGVLQRIAVVYLIAAVLALYTGRKMRIAVGAGLLVAYWLLMTRVNAGFGAGNLSPDGNLAAVIDRRIMYEHLWVKHRWDPEGLLSTLPAIVTCILGVFTGEWLRKPVSAERKAQGMVVAGAVLMALGAAWNVWFPINKNLWTSSYVLYTGGMAMALLALCYWAVEIRGWRKWGAPFVWYGSNAITVYALSSALGKYSVIKRVPMDGKQVLLKTWVYHRVFEALPLRPVDQSLAFASCYVLTFLVLAWIMYRKKIFIKV